MIHVIEHSDDSKDASSVVVADGFLFPEVGVDLTRLAEIKAAAQEAETCDWRSLFHSLISITTKLSVQIQFACEAQTVIQEQIQSLKSDRQLVTMLQDDSRKLREEFHEREVLKPVILALISVADRCEDEIRRLKTLLKSYADDAFHDEALAIRHRWNARKTDLAEINQLIISMGVEIFQNPESKFVPSLQSPIAIQTDESELADSIASRVRPGFRRGKLMIRKEIVKVFVYRDPSPQESQGDLK